MGSLLLFHAHSLVSQCKKLKRRVKIKRRMGYLACDLWTSLARKRAFSFLCMQTYIYTSVNSEYSTSLLSSVRCHFMYLEHSVFPPASRNWRFYVRNNSIEVVAFPPTSTRIKIFGVESSCAPKPNYIIHFLKHLIDVSFLPS